MIAYRLYIILLSVCTALCLVRLRFFCHQLAVSNRRIILSTFIWELSFVSLVALLFDSLEDNLVATQIKVILFCNWNIICYCGFGVAQPRFQRPLHHHMWRGKRPGVLQNIIITDLTFSFPIYRKTRQISPGLF